MSIEKPDEIVVGDNTVVTCSVSNLYTNKSPQWYRVSANGSLTMLIKQTSVTDSELVPICKENILKQVIDVIYIFSSHSCFTLNKTRYIHRESHHMVI